MSNLAAQAQALANRYLPSEADETYTQVRRTLARGGRPTTLTEDTIDKLGDTIAQTAEYIEDACLAHGIPRRNYYNWLKQGEADDEAGIESIHARFWRTLKAAESQGLVKLGQLWVANPRDFAAYATRKERKAPGKWARRDERFDGPMVLVEIGVKGDTVKVGVAMSHNAGLSPANINDLACGNQSQVEMLSPINRDYVNQLEATNASVPAPSDRDREIPAVESRGGTLPPPGAAGGQRLPAMTKGRSAGRQRKKA